MYEQDWMCKEYDGVTALQDNVTMGDLWLKGMAEGAEVSYTRYILPLINTFIAVCTPIYTRYTCIYTIYTP